MRGLRTRRGPGALVERARRLPPHQPATAAKGLNQLAADGLLCKRRGVGMFVATGAHEQLLKRRRSEFADQYLRPVMVEAHKLGISTREVTAMLQCWEEAR